MSTIFEEQNDLLSSFSTEETMSPVILVPDSLKVVKASFTECVSTNWEKLFDGFDNLFAITFSSGIDFVNKVISKFKHSEIIFGCEGVMNNDTAAIIAMQAKVIQKYVKHKSAFALAEKLADGSLDLYVSRDTKSHEKIYILSSEDGRYRVITGSANMSSSAFCGIQRENILCFDDKEAFDYYKDLFEDFKNSCSDSVSYNAIIASISDNDYLEDNIQEIPIVRTIEDKKMVFLEEKDVDSDDFELVAGVKGFEAELKTMLPKSKKQNGKWFITGEAFKEFKRNYSINHQIKKEKEKKLPKLHIDYETRTVDFNGKQIDLNPSMESIQLDIKSLKGYFQGFQSFNGNILQTQKSYYAFMNWFFSSVFMPHLRLVAHYNNYEMMPFPVYGIIYGDSNGGKSTFTRLLSKMMCGQKVPVNSSVDFVSTNIENLKRG
ncbi:MAG: phospholipase D family protein, partial [Clostridia bacterium]|nr:phospholipase D family protein [Clostridia bacterium]